MSRLYLTVVLAIVCGVSLCADIVKSTPHDQQVGSPLMNTNIALVGADPSVTDIHSLNNVVVDPSRLMDQARKGYSKDDDIEEDENDRFISSRKGKLRPRFESGPGADDWAEELVPAGRVLSRPKRSKEAEKEEKHYKHHKDWKKRGDKNKEDKEVKKDKKEKHRARGGRYPSQKEEHSSDTTRGPSEYRRHKGHPRVIYLIDNDKADTGGKARLNARKKEVMKNSKLSKEVRVDDDSDDDLADSMELEGNKSSDDSAASSAKIARKLKVLSRVKRCGGGGDDDDDDDANRSRRSRRARRRRARRKARRARKRAEKAAQSTTTTVTRRIIQDGQVISQDGATQTACTQQQNVPQPIILQQPAPATVIQNGIPQTIVQQPGQPMVQGVAPVQPMVQNVAPTQPIVQNVVPAQPVIQQQAVAPAQPGVQQAAAPSMTAAAQGSLQGSVQKGATVEGSMKISA